MERREPTNWCPPLPERPPSFKGAAECRAAIAKQKPSSINGCGVFSRTREEFGGGREFGVIDAYHRSSAIRQKAPESCTTLVLII
jgi:hypothetical protein